jgi:N utilization substance protein A
VASIEGFDEDTGAEIQARAQEFLDKEAAELDAKRKELGVEDGLLEIEGITLPMAVALGAGDVKSVEDLAGLVPDDLRGWFESKNGERVREPGILESYNLEPADAELLIMRARVVMGWVEAPPEPEVVEEEAGEEVFAEAEAGAEPTEEHIAEAEAAGEAQDA